MTRPLPELLADADALEQLWLSEDMPESYRLQALERFKALLASLYPQLREAAQDRERMREALEELERRTRPQGDMADQAVHAFVCAALARKD